MATESQERLTSGEKPRHLVVFLHGLGGSSREWIRFEEVMTDHFGKTNSAVRFVDDVFGFWDCRRCTCTCEARETYRYHHSVQSRVQRTLKHNHSRNTAQRHSCQVEGHVHIFRTPSSPETIDRQCWPRTGVAHMNVHISSSYLLCFASTPPCRVAESQTMDGD